MLGNAARSGWQPQAREQLTDGMVSWAMSLAQTLGRWRGGRLLRNLQEVPEPLRADSVTAYVSGDWTVESRVVVEQDFRDAHRSARKEGGN